MIDLEDFKATAKDLLEGGDVTKVIAYGRGTSGMMAQPVFITDPADLDQLTWNPTCVHNLALYLTSGGKRCTAGDSEPVAVVVKGCDSRAVNVLLQENFIQRDKVFVLGVSCEGTGVLDEKKLAGVLEGKQPLQASFAADGKSFTVKTRSGEVTVPAKDVLADRCHECRAAHPVIYDHVWGEEDKERESKPFAGLKAFEKAHKGHDAQFAFWDKTMERCIRCFACRSICPMCYCDECVVDSIQFAVTEETTPEEKAQRIKWIERSSATSENFGYHIIRAMHLAGRCVDCGECERVCPVDIPLRLLNTKLERETVETFHYEVGFDTEQPSLVSSFNDKDPGGFIR